MKKVILFFAVAMCSVLMMAQTNQITWVNGRAVLGQSITSIDSIKYGTIEDADQLVLWLPKTIIVHDTVKIPYVVHDTVIVHDTIIINKCDGSHAPEGVEMVDLGLPSGLKWANMNVGATSPEGYGDYFAWGETSPKTSYNWSTYFDTNDDGSTFIKYNHDGGKTVLDLVDDAAHVNWGGNWRMPTKAEQDELIKNCTWTWTSNYNNTGVSGRIVRSKKNSNSIFLPASGLRSDSSLLGVGYGGYWSSSLDSYYSDGAFRFVFNSDGVDWYYSGRYGGLPVRPVCQ